MKIRIKMIYSRCEVYLLVAKVLNLIFAHSYSMFFLLIFVYYIIDFIVYWSLHKNYNHLTSVTFKTLFYVGYSEVTECRNWNYSGTLDCE